MARDGRYRVPLKRRRLGLTNYYKRRIMVLSGRLRLVARRTARTIIAQVVKVRPEGDVTLACATSKDLERFGWRGHPRNTPAAYLVGLLLGYRALERGIKEAVLDIGLHTPSPGSKVFAVAKGAIDAGLKVPMGEGVAPDEGRIRGDHIANYARMLKESDPERYSRQFAEYLRRGLDPEDLPGHFEEVREAIARSFGRVPGPEPPPDKR